MFDAPIVTAVSDVSFSFRSSQHILNFRFQDMKKVERNLLNEARNADLLIIWTDCDREGEHIGSEVADVCRKANRRIVVKRARFSAIIAA